jgi:hypothetical protein
MTIKEIIDGLKFTVDMFLFDPSTGETYKEPRNDMDKTTIDACKGAIELLEQTRWIPVSERLPEENGFYLATCDGKICGENEPFTGLAEYENGKWVDDEEDYQCVLAWMPLPQPYKAESEANTDEN